MVNRQQIEAIAKILISDYGTDNALQYCKAKIDSYEERIKITPSTFNELNEIDSHKLMIEFYIAVSLILQNK